jgi:hypothetical protein
MERNAAPPPGHTIARAQPSPSTIGSLGPWSAARTTRTSRRARIPFLPEPLDHQPD